MASKNIVELDVKNFDSETTGGEPILVDFWAEWCGPCRMVAPVLDQLAEERAGQVKVGKLNIDNHPELASKYQVQSIPTFMIFKDGEVVDRMMGAMSKGQFDQFLDRNMPKPAAVQA